MSLKNFGTIKKLGLEGKGYTKLVISVNLPFRTKYLQFNVWSKDLLFNSADEKQFQLKDQLEVEYYYKGDFLELTSLTKTCLEYCPVCFNALEEIESQRMECGDCSIMPNDERKERINDMMTLIACTEKQYRYSVGYRLKLSYPEWKSSFITVVFPNKLFLYSKIPHLEVGKRYKVVGWKDGNLFDLLDICEVD